MRAPAVNCGRCSPRVSTWIRTTSASCIGPDCTEVSPGGLPSLHRRSALINPRPQNLGFFLAWPPRSTPLSPPCYNNPRPPESGPAPKTRRSPMRAWSRAFLAVAVLALSGCGYNTLQAKDEAVKAAWSEVVNQYQRRADLIPNLVNTVKGYAAQEQRVLVEVTEARARVGSIQVTPEVLNNPELFKKFQDAQNQLTGALKSLFAVTENYPQLKSDQNFRDLQSQLEGTENRITVARNRYIQAVQDYNVTVRTFPTLITAKVFGFQVKPNFTVANEQQISTAPPVSFDTATPGAPATPPPQPAGKSPTQ